MKLSPYLKTVRKRGRQRLALTVIELLAATALATMLMAAVLGVLKSMTQGQKALLGNTPAEPWQMRFVEQLEWDLTNSQSIQTTSDGIRLEGFAGRDFTTGVVVHRPTRIEYSVVKQGEQKCLIRREVHTDSLNLDNTVVEIVCTGVERIVIAPPDDKESVATTNETLPEQSRLDGPIPARLVVMLFLAGESEPVFSHAFVLR